MPASEESVAISKAWMQGSFLPPELLTQLDPGLPSGCIGVVVSHSCDLANESMDKEPWFEWIPAATIDKADKNRMRSRSPRELHLAGAGPGGSHLGLLTKDRHIHSRTLLEGNEPVGGLDEPSTGILATWMSRRYARTALPDAFNDRRSRIASQVRKLLDRGNQEHLTGLWVMLHTQEELKEEAYRIALRGTTAKAATPAQKASARALFDEIVDLLGACPGIEVGHDELRSEEQFPLSDLDVFLRMDDWDDLSRG
ncbi:MAG: hypothetical protein IPN71_16495 [Fibrobacteres bacterium]|nr:hypothetical protein [Fibrobacterota bacterium]